MFSLICARVKGWIKNVEAGDLRRHRAHYDVSVMVMTVYSLFMSFNRENPYVSVVWSWIDMIKCRKWLHRDWGNYIDVIMGTIASQITSLTVVYSTVYSGADQRKHQSSTSLAFVWGIHRDRWIPRTKGQLRGKCFHLMTSSWNIPQSTWFSELNV